MIVVVVVVTINIFRTVEKFLKQEECVLFKSDKIIDLTQQENILNSGNILTF